MKFLEVGKKHTVSLIEDAETAILYPGDIVEFYLIPAQGINKYTAFLALKDAFRIKESYHNIVVHYLRIDDDKVTIQCSAAPPGATIGSPITVAAIKIIAVTIIFIAAVIGFSLYYSKKCALERAKLLGSVGVNAKKCDTPGCETPSGISVPFSLDGVATTTPHTVKDLQQGNYTVTWGKYDGYQTPSPSPVTVVAGQKVDVPGIYYKDGVTPPTTGILVIDTSGAPVKGDAAVDGEWIGETPLSLKESVGTHSVAFSALKGYITPIMQTIKVLPYPPDPTPVTGIYIPEEVVGLPAWAKGAIAVGGTVLGVGVGIKVLGRIRRRK